MTKFWASLPGGGDKHGNGRKTMMPADNNNTNNNKEDESNSPAVAIGAHSPRPADKRRGHHHHPRLHHSQTLPANPHTSPGIYPNLQLPDFSHLTTASTSSPLLSINAPPPTPNSQATTGPGPSQATIEKYSTVLLCELKKKPQKEKALKDALEMQEHVQKLEMQLQAAENEAGRRRTQLEEQLAELDRKKADTKRTLEAVAVTLEQSKAETRKQLESVQQDNRFRDRAAIEKMSREIEQLNFHASKVRTLMASLNSSIEVNVDERDDSVPSVAESTPSELAYCVCPVCLAVPDDAIFSCVQCDNLVCGNCRGKISSCPTCRKNFKNHPPRRNRLAERLLSSRR